MKQTLYRQVTLRDGNSSTICWVDREVEVGNRVTLKTSEDPERWWTVTWVGSQKYLKEELNDSRWEVGGLGRQEK